MSYTLTDLDELVLTVRDTTSRDYIHEAIVAYRNRAYRAAIVSTWIAVTYDILSKLRELANQGDTAASAVVRELDNAISNSNIEQLQRLESRLLQKAQQDFELIGPREYEDLDRLKNDRNPCAHPAFTAETTLFAPSPELVRTHIVHAIQHLLMHAPIQGKAALARIKEDILRPSFPIDQERISDFLEAKYLNYAKPSLIKTLVTVFLKVIVQGSDPDLIGYEETVVRCLKAVALKYPALYESEIQEQLPKITSSADDDQLYNIFILLSADPQCWGWLDRPTRVRMEEIVYHFSITRELSPTILNTLSIPALRKPIIDVFESLDDSKKEDLLSQNPRPELASEAVKLYADVGSFRRAEHLGTSILLPFAHSLSVAQVQEVLKAVQSNNQIYAANKTPEILSEFFTLTERHHRTTAKAWQELMEFLVALDDDPNWHYTCPDLRNQMTMKGMWPVAMPDLPF